jgi:hypothetical protein
MPDWRVNFSAALSPRSLEATIGSGRRERRLRPTGGLKVDVVQYVGAEPSYFGGRHRGGPVSGLVALGDGPRYGDRAVLPEQAWRRAGRSGNISTSEAMEVYNIASSSDRSPTRYCSTGSSLR